MHLWVHLMPICGNTSEFMPTDGASCWDYWIWFNNVFKLIVFIIIWCVSQKAVCWNSYCMPISILLLNILPHFLIIVEFIFSLIRIFFHMNEFFVRCDMSILKLVILNILLLWVSWQRGLLILSPDLRPNSIIIIWYILVLIPWVSPLSSFCKSLNALSRFPEILKLLHVSRFWILGVLVRNEPMLRAQAHGTANALVRVSLGGIQVLFDIRVRDIIDIKVLL